MRDRLIELLAESAMNGNYLDIQHVADHLLANGVIVPPCKVGDTVWDREAEPWRVISIEWFSKKVTHLHCVSPVTGVRHTFSVGKRSVGKTVFLTCEEAEKALSERRADNDRREAD